VSDGLRTTKACGYGSRIALGFASHPPGCTCAVHLAWRKKAVGAGSLHSIVMAGLETISK